MIVDHWVGSSQDLFDLFYTSWGGICGKLDGWIVMEVVATYMSTYPWVTWWWRVSCNVRVSCELWMCHLHTYRFLNLFIRILDPPIEILSPYDICQLISSSNIQLITYYISSFSSSLDSSSSIARLHDTYWAHLIIEGVSIVHGRLLTSNNEYLVTLLSCKM